MPRASLLSPSTAPGLCGMRYPLRILLLGLFAFAIAGAAARPAESTHLKMIVGLTDDTAKWMARQDGVVGVHRDLRLMAEEYFIEASRLEGILDART